MYNDTIKVRCLSGKQFATGQISIEKRCNESLVWDSTDDLPGCVPLKCPPLTGIPEFTEISPVQTSYSLSEEVTFSCVNDSYQVIGEKTRKCLPDQSWSGSMPFCQIKECPDPGNVVGATRSYDSFNVNETVKYTCDEGHEKVTGDSTILCMPSGLWQGDKPLCSSNVFSNILKLS